MTEQTEQAQAPALEEITDANVADVLANIGEEDQEIVTEEQAEAEAAESEEETEENPEEEAEEEGEKTAEPLYEVIVDGEKIQVSQSELIKGYSRESDYTRKTQALSEKEKHVDAQMMREREYYTQELEYFASEKMAELEKVFAPIFEENHWNSLDSLTKIEMKQEYKDRKEAILSKQREAQQMRQALTQKQEHQFQQYRASEYAKWGEHIPEAKDPAKWKATQGDMEAYLSSKGFTPEQMGLLIDRRLAGVVYEGMKYSKLQTAKPQAMQKVQQAPKMQKPGASQGVRDGQMRMRSLKAAALKSGDSDLTAAYLAEL